MIARRKAATAGLVLAGLLLAGAVLLFAYRSWLLSLPYLRLENPSDPRALLVVPKILRSFPIGDETRSSGFLYVKKHWLAPAPMTRLSLSTSLTEPQFTALLPDYFARHGFKAVNSKVYSDGHRIASVSIHRNEHGQLDVTIYTCQK